MLSPAIARIQPSAALEIDGETYRLLFDFNALAEAERLTGHGLLRQHPAKYFRDLDAAGIRGFLYAALKAEHPQISVDAVGALLRVEFFQSIFGAISKAWILSMPERSKEDSGRRKAQAELTESEAWQQCYTAARIRLGLSDREFGAITPRRLRILLDEEEAAREESRLLFGVVAAAVANFSMGRGDRVLTPQDFVGGHPGRPKVERIDRKASNERIRAFLMSRVTSRVERKTA